MIDHKTGSQLFVTCNGTVLFELCAPSEHKIMKYRQINLTSEKTWDPSKINEHYQNQHHCVSSIDTQLSHMTPYTEPFLARISCIYQHDTLKEALKISNVYALRGKENQSKVSRLSIKHHQNPTLETQPEK